MAFVFSQYLAIKLIQTNKHRKWNNFPNNKMETTAHCFDTIILFVFMANNNETVWDLLSLIVTIPIPEIIFTEWIDDSLCFLLNYQMITLSRIPGRVHGMCNYSTKWTTQIMALKYWNFHSKFHGIFFYSFSYIITNNISMRSWSLSVVRMVWWKSTHTWIRWWRFWNVWWFES